MCYYLLKRKGRLKPTTARDSLKKPSGCKNPSAVLAMAALVEVGPIVKKLRSCRKWERFHNFLGSFSGRDVRSSRARGPLARRSRRSLPNRSLFDTRSALDATRVRV